MWADKHQPQFSPRLPASNVPHFLQELPRRSRPLMEGVTKALPGAFGFSPALFQLSQEKRSTRAAAASGQRSSVPPPLPSRTERFWMKWEKRIKKCFPIPSSLWTQGWSAHPKFYFHLDTFRIRQKFQNQKAVQKLCLFFIKIFIFRFGDQFLDIFLTGSWGFFL